jgi:uncharacterized protein YndB with AHSA1/START domain
MNTTDTLQITKDGSHAITIDREFEAPIDKVFRAMTDPELIAQWMGPRYLTNTEVHNDAHHGGTWGLVQRDPDGNEYAFRGVFHGDQTPELSMRTFEWLGMPGHVSFETLRLEDLGNGRTRAHSVSVFTTTEDRDGMADSGMDTGVREGYERLDEVLETL